MGKSERSWEGYSLSVIRTPSKEMRNIPDAFSGSVTR